MRPARSPLFGSLLMLVLLASSSGCVTAITVEPIPLDHPVPLAEGEGFLLVEVDSDSPVHTLVIDSADGRSLRVRLSELAKGRRTLLVRAPAGRYRWSRVEIMGYTYRSRRYPFFWDFDPEEDRWQFDVEAGKTNYPGALALRSKQVGARNRWLSAFTLNRSGEMAARLVGRSGGWLISRHPATYTGAWRDDFLEFYSSRLADRSPPATESEDAP